MHHLSVTGGEGEGCKEERRKQREEKKMQPKQMTGRSWRMLRGRKKTNGRKKRMKGKIGSGRMPGK